MEGVGKPAPVFTMNAEFYSFELDINYRCPNCKLFFRLSNRNIPTKKSINYICDGCNSTIVIPPVAIVIVPEKTRTKTKTQSYRKEHPFGNAYVLAKKAILKYGWSREDADNLLMKAINENSLPDDVEPSVLVKLALANAGVPDERT